MARLIVNSGAEKGREFTLASTQTIGRLQSNTLPISDTRMSRENTRIAFVDGAWTIEDLDSKNGTFVNGERVMSRLLADQDEIRVGETFFRFLTDAGQAPPPVSAVAFGDVAAAVQPQARGRDKASGDRILSYSRHSQQHRTMTSMLWLRQDIGQRTGVYKALVFVGIALIMAGLAWLVQIMVAQG